VPDRGRLGGGAGTLGPVLPAPRGRDAPGRRRWWLPAGGRAAATGCAAAAADGFAGCFRLGPSGRGSLECPEPAAGRISRIVTQGPLVRVSVDCGVPLIASITRASAVEMGLAEGGEVVATFKASAVHLIPLAG